VATSPDEVRPATREETFPIALAAVLLSFVALLLSFSRGYLLLYGDAVAHLGIARRILDSRNPGLIQLGGVWLPLPTGANATLAYRRPNSTQEGATLGLASLLVLPVEACGLAVTSAMVGYLAGESAGQCGPCMFGLPAIAGDLEALASGSARPELLERLHRRLGVIPGRGACAHPDGATRLAASALEVFAQDIAEHARGRPCGRAGTGTLPVLGELASGERGWR